MMEISIHALLAESDFFNTMQIVIIVVFLSTLSLRRATQQMPLIRFFPVTFLSTLSLRRATNRRPIFFWQAEKFLSTLSLRRATASSQSSAKSTPISIHALLAESDRPLACSVGFVSSFLSTLSLRRATSLRHPA